jgi:hypothetical protein
LDAGLESHRNRLMAVGVPGEEAGDDGGPLVWV